MANNAPPPPPGFEDAIHVNAPPAPEGFMPPDVAAKRAELLRQRDELDKQLELTTLGGTAKSIGSALDDNVRLGANGISLGFLDKALGQEDRAKTDAARGRQGYTGMASEMLGSLAPMAAVGGIGNAASKVPGMFEAGAKLASTIPGLTTASRLAAPAASGAAWGAATAMGNDTPISEGAAWGAGLGVLGQAVGAGINKGYSALASRQPAIPSEELRKAADAGYGEMRQAGLVFSPDAFSTAIDDATASAAQRGIGGPLAGITDELTPKASKVVEKLNAMKGTIAPNLSDVEMLKRALNGPGFDADAAANQQMAGVFKDLIDNAAPSDFISGNVKQGLEGIDKGRENWQKMLKTQVLEKVKQKALDKVGANYTQAGLLTALRQEMKAVKNAKNFASQWTPEEQALITQVVRGRSVENVARLAGLFAPRGPITGGIIGATAAYGNPVIAGTIAGAGLGGRALATRMGTNRFADLVNTVQGAKGTPKLSPQTQENIKALIRAMMMGGTTAAVTQGQ